MDEEVLTEVPPVGGAADTPMASEDLQPEEQREEATPHTHVEQREEATPHTHVEQREETSPHTHMEQRGQIAPHTHEATEKPSESGAAAERLTPAAPADLGQNDAGGQADGPPQEEQPPEDWLEPLDEDDFEDEDEMQSGSRDGSVSGSMLGVERSGRGRGGRGGRRPRLLVEEDWDDWPGLGQGWKRKEVFRRSGCYAGKSDTYYMSPSGVRLRSKVELAKCLSGSMDLGMFDFKSGHFLSEQPPRKRRRWTKGSMQSDQSQEEDQLLAEKEQSQEEDQLLAEKERPPAKRKRAKNFSDVEKRRLHQLVLSFPAAESRSHGSSSETDRSTAWAEVCQRFNSATKEPPRTLHQLQLLWRKVRLTGVRRAARRQRGPLARGAALIKLRRKEMKRQRRRALIPRLVPALSPRLQQQLQPCSPSSPLQPNPASPSLPTPLTIKQESGDTLISTYEHTLMCTHTLVQEYNPTTAEHALSNSPQHPPSNSPQHPSSNSPTNAVPGHLVADGLQETKPSCSTEPCVRVNPPPPCAMSVRRRRRRSECERRLSEQLALTFHRQRMRFLRQEHELRMRVLNLELALKEQEQDLLHARAANTTNHSAPHCPAANHSTPHLPDSAHGTTPDPQSPAFPGPSHQLSKQSQTANALMALISGSRKRARQDPPSRPPYPDKHKRHGTKQAGRNGAGSKSHTLPSKKNGSK